MRPFISYAMKDMSDYNKTVSSKIGRQQGNDIRMSHYVLTEYVSLESRCYEISSHKQANLIRALGKIFPPTHFFSLFFLLLFLFCPREA